MDEGGLEIIQLTICRGIVPVPEATTWSWVAHANLLVMLVGGVPGVSPLLLVKPVGAHSAFLPNINTSLTPTAHMCFTADQLQASQSIPVGDLDSKKADAHLVKRLI